MIDAVGGASRTLPLRGVTDARNLEPLIALLEAAARREDVVQLLGTSPAAALLDGLADKARAVADLMRQGAPAPEPVVVQATATRLPQAVADVLADQLFTVATQPLPPSLETSVRVLSAGSPLVAAYLERAARYLVVCRLIAAGRHDIDALVEELKHAASNAEAINGDREEPEAPIIKLLTPGPSDAPAESSFVPHRADVATLADVDVQAAAVEAAAVLARPLVLLDDELPELEPDPPASDGEGEPVAVADGESSSPEPESSEPPSESPAPPQGSASPEADAPPAPGRTSWRALPQMVTASYHVVPVAVALDQLRDGAQWISTPNFPADADEVMGDAAAGLASRDREALRAMGDRTARETPALARAVTSLRLPPPWSAEVLAALAPPASRPTALRLSEQVRVLATLTVLRESREPAPAPDARHDLRARLLDESAKPLPADVRALLDAMALDPAARPMLGRAVRYVLATRALRASTSDGPASAGAATIAPTGADLSDGTLEGLLGDELPSLGAIDRAMLRALALRDLAFKQIQSPPAARRKRARGGAAVPVRPAYSAVVEGEIVHGDIRLLDMAFADRPLRERPIDVALRTRAADDRLMLVLAVALVFLIWLLFH